MKNLIDKARLLFADIDSTAFTDKQIASFVNEARCMIAQLKPELYTSSKIYKAKVGEVQCVSGCCSRLISVDGVVDRHGNPVSFAKKGSTTLSKQFTKKKIETTEAQGYTYEIRSGVMNKFEVQPPIKPSDDVYFRITCSYQPEALELDGVLESCENHSAILNYTLYRMFSTETESQTSTAHADRYIKLFFDIIGVQRKTEAELNKYREGGK